MLFDPDNPRSNEVKGALALADVLACLSLFQELAEGADDAIEARKHVTVGVFDKPASGHEFDIDELAELGFQMRIISPDDSTIDAIEGHSQVSSAGAFEVHYRRYVRENEDEQDVYLFVWDRMGALRLQLAEALAVAQCPRVQQGSVIGASGPYYNSLSEETRQGRYLHGSMRVSWGDAIGD
jgi:hypothetical protein